MTLLVLKSYEELDILVDTDPIGLLRYAEACTRALNEVETPLYTYTIVHLPE